MAFEKQIWEEKLLVLLENLEIGNLSNNPRIWSYFPICLILVPIQ